MAVKSVIDIDVKDEKFQRFKELFDQYNALLAKQPKMWGDVGAKQQELVGHFQKMTAALMAHAQVVRDTSDAGTQQANTLMRSEGLWTSILTKSRGVLGNVMSTAEGLLKWTGILGMVGGLLGLGGGIFGLDLLANSTADKRRRAMGYGFGTRIGEVSAFDATFGRLIDTQGFLGNLNAMETDVTQQTAAYALLGHGLSGNTMTDALSMLTAARGLAGRTPTNLLGPMFSAYGLNFSADEMRRLQGSPAEFQQLTKEYQEKKGPLDIQEKIAKGWQDLVTQWELATKEIAAILANDLAPLQGPLTRMSEALVSAAEHMPDLEKAITTFGSWIDWLSDKISHIQELIGGAKQVAEHPLSSAWSWAGAYLRNPNQLLQNMETGRLPGANTATRSIKDYLAYLGQLDKYYNLPAGTLERIKMIESGKSMDPNITNPQSGAKGLMQFMPATAHLYGLDPGDALESGRGAGAYMRDLLKKYHGDLGKAVAAYDGARDLDKIIAQHPNDWQRFVNPETRNYLARFGPPEGVRIIIEDKTGGNVNVSAAALGAPAP